MNMDHYEFTKSHTQIAKGVAIILMMMHHLFKFPDRLHEVSYISILPFYNPTVEYIIGDFGRICVGMYLFLSGYGLYITYSKNKIFIFKDSVKKMFDILVNYWIVFLIFIPIGFWYNINSGYKWDLVEFFENLLTLSSSYNNEWWFLGLYIELLLLFPLIMCMLKKNIILSLVISISIYFLSIGLPVIFKLFPQIYFIKSSFIYSKIIEISLWQIIFIVGCIVAKYNIFKVINVCLLNKKLDRNWFYLLAIFIIIGIRFSGTIVSDYIGIGSSSYIDSIFSPLFILFCTNLIYKTKIENIFTMFGRHSTNIWFTHTFFVYYYFQQIIFFPKWSVLIVAWLSVLTIISSAIINNVRKDIYIFVRLLYKKIVQVVVLT